MVREGERPWSLADTAWWLMSVQAALAAGFRDGLRDLERFGVAEGAPAVLCHCLCALHSRSAPGVCRSVSEPGLVVVRFSALMGTVVVPLCRACFDAMGAG